MLPICHRSALGRLSPINFEERLIEHQAQDVDWYPSTNAGQLQFGMWVGVAMAREFDLQWAQREVVRVLRLGAKGDIRQRVPNIAHVLEGMAVFGASRSEPIRSIGALLGDRWSTLIVHVLRDGPFRYAVLHRLVGAVNHINAISQRMLSLRLHTLEREGLVKRIVSQSAPPQVSYVLTDMGISFAKEADSFSHWVISHMSEVKSARERFDARRRTLPANSRSLRSPSAR